MLVMKGLSLSSYYGKHATREFGDLDIYTFGNQNNATRIIESLGIKIDVEEKHDVFNYKNIHVEHHITFLSVDFKIGKILNDYLLFVCK